MGGCCSVVDRGPRKQLLYTTQLPYANNDEEPLSAPHHVSCLATPSNSDLISFAFSTNGEGTAVV